MANEVAPSKDFQERLYEKIRTDIGALMTDEELKKLVATTMERVWFSPVKKHDGYRTTEEPPRIETLVKGLLEPSLIKAMQGWLDEHPDVVKDALDKALSGGLSTAVLNAFNSMLSAQFSSMGYNLEQALQNALQRR